VPTTCPSARPLDSARFPWNPFGPGNARPEPGWIGLEKRVLAAVLEARAAAVPGSLGLRPAGTLTRMAPAPRPDEPLFCNTFTECFDGGSLLEAAPEPAKTEPRRAAGTARRLRRPGSVGLRAFGTHPVGEVDSDLCSLP